jgi:capsular exopolysaccharide synthesis family protein
MRVRQPLTEADEFDRLPEVVSPEHQSFDVQALWRVVVARRLIILGTVVAALGVTLAAWMMIVPVYSATAVLMLDQRKNSVADVETVLGGLPTDPASMQNQIQILTSRKLATSVIQKLGLDREFGAIRSETVEGPALEASVDRVLKHLSVEQAGLSTTLTISVAAADASQSARITNAWVDAYIEDQMNAKFEATQKAAAWLELRVGQLASQVQGDDAAVQKYKAENGIVDTGTGGSLVDQQTANVSTQLINAKAELAQKTAAYQRILELQRSGRAGDASQVLASPLIIQLRTQQAELERQQAQYAGRYLSQHPKLIDIRAQVRDTRSRIAVEIRRAVEGLANEVAVARANAASLETSLKGLQTAFQDQNSASVKLKALESIAASSRSRYEALLSRLKEVQGQEGYASPDVRIVSRAVAPRVASPRWASIFGIAVPASLALGILLAFVLEGLDTSLRSHEHVRRFLGLEAFATVPESTHGWSHESELVVREPASSFAEAIRGLYLGLTSAGAETPPKVVLVTSGAPAEGKTAIAISLARLAARGGRKVLLIDADLRHPSIASAMGLTSATGLVQVLRGEVPAERCIVTDPLSGAAVLLCTDKPRDPADLLSSGAMETLIAGLRSTYDFIVVDSAPLRPVHDTWPLTRFVDTTLLVVRMGATPREVVLTALRALRSMRANVAGVALARAKEDPEYGYRNYLAGANREGSALMEPSVSQRNAA